MAYYAEHDVLGTGPAPAAPRCFMIEEHPGHWAVQQIIDDPEGNHDWRITATVDLAASDEAGDLVLEHRLVQASCHGQATSTSAGAS